MEFLLHLLPIFTFSTLVLVTTHAASPPELYWRSVLPSAVMPKAVTDLLIPGICVSPGYMGGVTDHVANNLDGNSNPFAKNPNLFNYHQYADAPDDNSNPFAKNPNLFNYHQYAAHGEHTDDDSNPFAKNPNLFNYHQYQHAAHEKAKHSEDDSDSNPFAKNPNLFNYHQYQHAAHEKSKHIEDDSDSNPFAKNPNLFNYHQYQHAAHEKSKHTEDDSDSNPFAKNPNLFNYHQYQHAAHGKSDSNPFAKNPNLFNYHQYQKAAKGKSLYDNLSHEQGKVTKLKYGNMLFLEKDLHPGMKVELYFSKVKYPSILLPRQVANWLPFSSNKLQDIMNMFSAKPGSDDAHAIQETITTCEKPGLSMEDKYCATSLEAMVDFSTSLFGKNVYAISAEIEKETSQLRNYTILGMKRVDEGESPVSCHKMTYPYVVHYCHKIPKTRVYIVALEGTDGTKAKGIALCHAETSEWDQANVAFQVLKVKPGTPICHFNPMDTIIWLPRGDNHLAQFSN